MTIDEVVLAAAKDEPIEGLHPMEQFLWNRINLIYSQYRFHNIGKKEGSELKAKVIEQYKNEIERIRNGEGILEE